MKEGKAEIANGDMVEVSGGGYARRVRVYKEAQFYRGDKGRKRARLSKGRKSKSSLKCIMRFVLGGTVQSFFWEKLGEGFSHLEQEDGEGLSLMGTSGVHTGAKANYGRARRIYEFSVGVLGERIGKGEREPRRTKADPLPPQVRNKKGEGNRPILRQHASYSGWGNLGRGVAA